MSVVRLQRLQSLRLGLAGFKHSGAGPSQAVRRQGCRFIGKEGEAAPG